MTQRIRPKQLDTEEEAARQEEMAANWAWCTEEQRKRLDACRRLLQKERGAVTIDDSEVITAVIFGLLYDIRMGLLTLNNNFVEAFEFMKKGGEEEWQ